MRQLADQKLRFMFQGNSSAVAGALSEAVAKHNERNPESSVFNLNYGAVDPALTNDQCRTRYPDANDDFFFLTLAHAMDLLVAAIEQTQSADPLKIAKALEGASYEGITGHVTIRQDNHQLLQPLYVSTFRKMGSAGVKYDVERTGMGFGTDGRIEAKDTALPTTRKMQRPYNDTAEKKKAAVFCGLFMCSGRAYMRFAAAGGKE